MKRIYRVELSMWKTNQPYIYISRDGKNNWRSYRAFTPLRCARFLNMTMAMARRYEQSAYPKSATPDSPV